MRVRKILVGVLLAVRPQISLVNVDVTGTFDDGLLSKSQGGICAVLSADCAKRVYGIWGDCTGFEDGFQDCFADYGETVFDDWDAGRLVLVHDQGDLRGGS